MPLSSLELHEVASLSRGDPDGSGFDARTGRQIPPSWNLAAAVSVLPNEPRQTTIRAKRSGDESVQDRSRPYLQRVRRHLMVIVVFAARFSGNGSSKVAVPDRTVGFFGSIRPLIPTLLPSLNVTPSCVGQTFPSWGPVLVQLCCLNVNG